MTKEEFKALREKLSLLPKWPWNFILAKDSNALDTDYRIDIYSGEKIESIKALNTKDTYKQIAHYHGKNTTTSAIGIEWMKKNPKVKETIDFICNAPKIISDLLDEIEKTIK